MKKLKHTHIRQSVLKSQQNPNSRKKKLRNGEGHEGAAEPVRKVTKRVRKPAYERLHDLVEWLKFARGEDCELPGVPFALTRATMGPRNAIPAEVREWVDAYLRNVAEAITQGRSDSKASIPEIDLPQAPPPRIQILPSGERVLLKAFSAQHVLVEALDHLVRNTDVSRLRICPVDDRLFVALNQNSFACPPPAKCAQTLRSRRFYEKHHAAVRKQALAKYYEKRDRAAELKMVRRAEIATKSKRLGR
jgi:hypothetical protein